MSADMSVSERQRLRGLIPKFESIEEMTPQQVEASQVAFNKTMPPRLDGRNWTCCEFQLAWERFMGFAETVAESR